MSSEKDGRPGNRPGSAHEIQKLPRSTCVVCKLPGVKPMVENGRCRNEVACRLRVERQQRQAKR